MSGASQMFKFTQLRPFNGIDIIEVRKRHIPLYESGQETELLKSLEKEGLPRGLIRLNRYISSKEFINRVEGYEAFSNSENKKELSQFNLLILVLQKTIDFSKKNPDLNDHEALKDIVQFTKDTGHKLGLDLEKYKSEKINVDINTYRDDFYALLLQSSYFPEYRRFLEVIYRFLYITQSTGVENFLDAYFSENNNNFSDERYLIIKKLITGRILLPNSVRSAKKPLPKFKNPSGGSSSTVTDSISITRIGTIATATTRDPVKGTSFAIYHLTKEEPETRR